MWINQSIKYKEVYPNTHHDTVLICSLSYPNYNILLYYNHIKCNSVEFELTQSDSLSVADTWLRYVSFTVQSLDCQLSLLLWAGFHNHLIRLKFNLKYLIQLYIYFKQIYQECLKQIIKLTYESESIYLLWKHSQLKIESLQWNFVSSSC